MPAYVRHLANNWFIRTGVLAGIVPATFWTVGTWPGYMNADSALHWNEAARNSYSNWFPVMYSFLVKLSQVVCSSTALVVILQVAATLASVVFLISTLSTRPVVRNICAFIVMAWPQTGGTMVLVAKDALFSAAFLASVGSLMLLEKQRVKYRNSLLILLASCVVFMTTLRWNGPFVVLGLGIILLARRRSSLWQTLFVVTIALVFGLSLLFKPPFSDNSGGVGLRVSGRAIDLAWALRTDPSSYSKEELATIDYIAPRELWSESQRNCNNSAMPLLDGVFNETDGAGTRLATRQSEIRHMWIGQVTKNFDNFASGRFCRVKGLVFPARDWWPVSAQPSQLVFPTRLQLPPPEPLSQELVGWTGARLDQWGGSTLGIILAMPLFWMLFNSILLIRQQWRGPFSWFVLACSSTVPVSVFVSGAGLEPRYVWPSTLLLLTFAAATLGTHAVRLVSKHQKV